MDIAISALAPMLIAIGVMKVGCEAIAALVGNRLIRGILLAAASAIWIAWLYNYEVGLLIK